MSKFDLLKDGYIYIIDSVVNSVINSVFSV